MKVAVVGTRGFPHIQGGVESHCENLYSQLVLLGCSVTVFTRKQYISDPIDEYNGISLSHVSCPKNKFLEAIVHTLVCVIKAKKLKPDILHLHAIGPSLFAFLGRLLGLKVVVTNHGPDYMRKKWSLPAKIFLKFSERMGSLFAHRIISIADNIADDLKRKYNRPSSVIPNGVHIPAEVTTEECLQEFNLQRKKYILAVGRFVPEKGFHDLIKSFQPGHFEGWKIVLAGDADHEDSYSRQLKTLAAGKDNVVLTGFQTGRKLQELYSHAGLFVLPSYHEGLPIVLLEAMSYGLSCIASNIPANRNVRMEKDRFFRAGDVTEIQKKMHTFISKPWGEEDMVKQKNMIRDDYNWVKIADKTMSVYMSVMG